MSFDSTYNTNKYRMIFAPFTGINHHKSCVCFGVDLLENEEAVTYEWLFRVFLKAMAWKESNVIITNEDKSMKRAIKNVFNHTNHQLCM
jgi:MULE transposase domain